MEFVIFLLVIILATVTSFLVWRGKTIKKVKKEMDDMAEYASKYRQGLMDEGILEEYGSKSNEELQNELSNLQYRLNELKYPENKEALLEADQKKTIIEEILAKRQ